MRNAHTIHVLSLSESQLLAILALLSLKTIFYDEQNAKTIGGAVLCPLEGGYNYQQSTDQDPPPNLCSLSFQQQELSRKACHHTQMTHT